MSSASSPPPPTAPLGQDPRPLRIVTLQNVTVDLIEPHLRAAARESGWAASVRFGQFDGILQQASNAEDPIWAETPDLVLVFASLETLAPRLVWRFPSLGPEEIEQEVGRIGGFVASTLRALRRHTSAMVVWHGFETPPIPAYGVLDAQLERGQSRVVAELNEQLRLHLAQAGNGFVVEMDRIMARIGADQFYDRRYWHLARAPYGRAALAEIARQDLLLWRAAQGRARKCLVLDCDNTLWGGIVGEDGVSGIRLSSEHPGSSYHYFQQAVLSLYDRGVILALCSKNNEDDVWSVFRERPEMVLEERHIAAAQINWDDKVTNLRRIARDLNIGLDSLVFVDDSEFEINMVRELLPEVATLHLPPGKSELAGEILTASGFFDTLSVSAEDRRRGEMYRAESQRRALRDAVDDLGSYLASLEIAVRICPLEEATIARAAQLTQRTNQFNLMTRRVGESEMRELLADPASAVLTLQVRDRCGDYGMVGLAQLRRAEDGVHLENFLLSCRVIGRGVEDTLLAACLELARRGSPPTLHACFLPTDRNALVRDFLDSRGFYLDREESDGRFYHRPGAAPLDAMPAHLHSVETTLPPDFP